MSNQADVHSIDALKEFRVAMALFADEALAALGAVDMEARRTVQWLQHDRKMYWQDQIKRRREQVASAQAEVFRRKLAKTADSTPAYSEQKELLRKAEASLHEAEMRAGLVKKWEPALQQAILEYHGSTRRISNLASGDVPRGLSLLERLIDALEAYLRVTPPSGRPAGSPLAAIAVIAEALLAEDPEPESVAAASVAEPSAGDDSSEPPRPAAASDDPGSPAS